MSKEIDNGGLPLHQLLVSLENSNLIELSDLDMLSKLPLKQKLKPTT